MNDLTLQEQLQSPEPGVTGQGARGATQLLEYWRAISKRRWSILGLTVLVAILATLVVSGMRPIYRASASVLIEQGKSKIVSIEEIYSQGLMQREYYLTQAEILKSENLAGKVVQKLKLTTHPDFDPRQAQPTWFARLTGGASLNEGIERREEDIQRGVIQQFRSGLQVQLIRNSQIVQLSFVSYDPELAAKVPNALAEVYIESDLDARMAMTQKATEWLRERMGELRTKVDTSEKALQEYRDRERIVDAKGLVLSGAGRQLEELTRSLVEARQKRAEAEIGRAHV